MKVLIDTNILLDVLANRGEFALPAALLFRWCEVGKVQGYIYALSIPNIAYIMRKEMKRSQISDVLGKLEAIFTIADMKADDLKKAAVMPMNDYEDALQCVCAKRVKADYIVTRNVKDFHGSSIPAVTPGELLEHIMT